MCMHTININMLRLWKIYDNHYDDGKNIFFLACLLQNSFFCNDAVCVVLLPQICKSNQEMYIIFKSNASIGNIH